MCCFINDECCVRCFTVKCTLDLGQWLLWTDFLSFIFHTHNHFIFPSPGWNHFLWGREAGSVSSGLQASVFPACGCSLTQSSVPLRPGVWILVLRWERAVQDLQVCVVPHPDAEMSCWQDDCSAVCFSLIDCQLRGWNLSRNVSQSSTLIVFANIHLSFRVDISDTIMYVYEMLGAELLSNLYDKLGRLLTNTEQPTSWQVSEKHTRKIIHLVFHRKCVMCNNTLFPRVHGTGTYFFFFTLIYWVCPVVHTVYVYIYVHILKEPPKVKEKKDKRFILRTFVSHLIHFDFCWCFAILWSILLQHTEALLYGFQSIAETIDVNYSDVIPGLIGLIPRISINNVQLADTVMFTIGEPVFMGGLNASPFISWSQVKSNWMKCIEHRDH